MFRDAKVISKIETGKDLRPSEVSLFWFKKAMKFILKRPILYLKIQLNKLIHLFSPYEHIHDWEFFGIKEKIWLFKYIPLDLCYLIGFFYLGVILGIKKLKENYLLYLALLSFSFSIILFFVATRYRMSMVVFLIIFSSFGLTQIIDLFFQKKYLKFLFTIGLIILISFIFNYNFKEKKLCINKGLVSHLEKVMYYKDNLDYLSALKELESASNLEPENPLILNMLGEIYYNLNRLEEAKQMYKKIITRYPFFVDAYYNLGLIYNREGNFLEAKDILTKVIYLDPQDIQAHFELGRAYKGLGDKVKAKQEFWFVLNQIDLSERENREKLEQEFFELIEE
jgi:tetratricopeptide (TPR) repeat protein